MYFIFSYLFFFNQVEFDFDSLRDVQFLWKEFFSAEDAKCSTNRQWIFTVFFFFLFQLILLFFKLRRLHEFSLTISHLSSIRKVEVISDFSDKCFPQRRMPDVVQTGNGCNHVKWKNKMHVVDQQIIWILKIIEH